MTTIKQIMKNIQVEAEKLNEYIHSHKDNTTLFLVAGYPTSEKAGNILTILLGNQKASVSSLVTTMEENEDIATFVLEAAALYLAKSHQTGATVIKIPLGSGLGKTIRDILDKNKNSDETLKN